MNSMFGLALAATASFAMAHGGPDGPKGDSPSALTADGKVTFTPGQGITIDGGEDFSLNLVHGVQAKWRFVNMDSAPDTNGFAVRNARQVWSGHVFNEDVMYMLHLNFTNEAQFFGTDVDIVKDAWVKWRFMEGDTSEITMRIGRGKFRAGLEANGWYGGLEFAERSIASRTFATARSTGLLFEGQALSEDRLYWHAGLLNSDTAPASGFTVATGEEGLNIGENTLNWTFGARFDPNGSIGNVEQWQQGDLEQTGELQSTVGASVYIGREGRNTAASTDTTTINGYAAVKTGSGIFGQGEIWFRKDDVDGGTEADSLGWYLQGSYTMAPEEGRTQWGLALRISMVDLDDTPNTLVGAAPFEGSSIPALLNLGGPTGLPGDVLEVQAAINGYYNKHYLKGQFAYTFQQVSFDGATSDLDNHALEAIFTAQF